MDRDNKIIKEFQTSFNSTFWEVYLYAVLKNYGLDVNFNFSTPISVSLIQTLSLKLQRQMRQGIKHLSGKKLYTRRDGKVKPIWRVE